MHFFLIILAAASLAAQSVPAWIPTVPPNPKQYSSLTASGATRLPAGFNTLAPWGNTRRLATLPSRQRPSLPKIGLEPVGEARVLGGDLSGWQPRSMPDGSTRWRMLIQSPGATALRLHFANFSLPSGSLWIYPSGVNHSIPAILGPYENQGPNGDGDFYSGTIFADTAILEVASPNEPSLNLDRLIHIYSEATAESTPRAISPALRRNAPQVGTAAATVISAAPCEVDATCYPQYNNLAAATLLYTFQSDDGFSYVCNGAMINTRSQSLRPYVATANHCISSDSEARTVEAYFNYASRTCNQTPVMREDAFRVSGARFMAGGGWNAGDFALLLLNGNPPQGTPFLGWNASDMPFNTNFIGLHYPRGSWRRIAIGSRTQDQNQRIEGELAPSGFYYQLAYSLGLTEVGSSGSPILNESGQIFGTLSYGPKPPVGRSICDFRVQASGYGRFSSAFNSYRPFLDDETAPSLTLSNSSFTFNVESGAVVGSPTATTTLRSVSATPATVTLASSAPWLRARASAAQVSSVAPVTITLEVVPLTLTVPGTQTTSVTVSSGTSIPLTINASVTVVNRNSSVTLTVSPNPVLQSDPDPDGLNFFYTVTAAETAGIATQLTSFSIGGTDYSARIPEWFGSTQLGANSTLQVALRARNINVPSQVVFNLGGTDVTSRRTWTRTLSVPFQPKASRGQLTLSSRPGQVNQETMNNNCPWLQYLVVNETNGFKVRLTSLIADGENLSSDIAEFFDSLDIPAQGSTVGGICWSGIRPPDVIEVTVAGIDSLGNRTESRVSTRFVGPVANPATLSPNTAAIQFSALTNRTAPLAPIQLPLRISRDTAPWTARLAFTRKESSWLSIGPLSGTGNATITLTPSVAGLAEGTYSANLFIESAQTQPQVLLIPITFTVLAPRPAPTLASGGVVPNSTYRGPLTPGALASAFGTNLGNGNYIASRLPLPQTLGITRARVNGRVAPLLFAGAGQINFQVPWETPIGTATLEVEVAGQIATTTFPVTNINPGIYTSDGRQLVPNSSASRGNILLAFVTGIGLVTPPVPTGDAPTTVTPPVPTGDAPTTASSLLELPRPSGPVTATIGGVTARVLFAAIPYGLVGLMQVNLEVAPNTPTGDQPLVISVAGVASPPVNVQIRN